MKLSLEEYKQKDGNNGNNDRNNIDNNNNSKINDSSRDKR